VPDIEDPLTADPLLGPGLGLRPEDADEADAAAEVEAAEARAYGEIDDERYAEVDALLQQRWPEARIDPSLERIRALCEVLGDPQRAVPAIHLTGTNGKTSTARMTETLLRGLGLRTGTFTSPHLQETRERIAIDGRPLSRARFVEVYDDIAPYLEIVDGRTGHRLSFFEAVTGMAFAAFADAPVDVSVLEVGLGGSWDATNVADGAVAVLTRIDVDHAHLLGDTPAAIATEKVGIIKAGAVVVSAVQLPEVEAVIDARVAEVGATLLRAGR
jgi:dihydrofolate synthase/folylpolyglutamate synthase